MDVPYFFLLLLGKAIEALRTETAIYTAGWNSLFL